MSSEGIKRTIKIIADSESSSEKAIQTIISGDDVDIDILLKMGDSILPEESVEEVSLEIFDIGEFNAPEPRKVTALYSKRIGASPEFSGSEISSHARFSLSAEESSALGRGDRWIEILAFDSNGNRSTFLRQWIRVFQNVGDSNFEIAEAPETYLKVSQAEADFLKKSDNLESVSSASEARENLSVYSKSEVDQIFQSLPDPETYLKVSQAEADFLKKSDNLESVSSVSEARENLSVYSKSEVDQIFQSLPDLETYLKVSQAEADFLKKSDNLGSISSASEARENLSVYSKSEVDQMLQSTSSSSSPAKILNTFNGGEAKTDSISVDRKLSIICTVNRDFKGVVWSFDRIRIRVDSNIVYLDSGDYVDVDINWYPFHNLPMSDAESQIINVWMENDDTISGEVGTFFELSLNGTNKVSDRIYTSTYVQDAPLIVGGGSGGSVSRVRCFNFNPNSENAPYSVSDYADEKDIPSSLTPGAYDEVFNLVTATENTDYKALTGYQCSSVVSVNENTVTLSKSDVTGSNTWAYIGFKFSKTIPAGSLVRVQIKRTNTETSAYRIFFTPTEFSTSGQVGYISLASADWNGSLTLEKSVALKGSANGAYIQIVASNESFSFNDLEIYANGTFVALEDYIIKRNSDTRIIKDSSGNSHDAVITGDIYHPLEGPIAALIDEIKNQVGQSN